MSEMKIIFRTQEIQTFQEFGKLMVQINLNLPTALFRGAAKTATGLMLYLSADGQFGLAGLSCTLGCRI